MAIRVGLRIQLLAVTLLLLGALTAGALGAVYYYLGAQVHNQASRQVRASAELLTAVFDRTSDQLLGRGRVLVALPSLQAALTGKTEALEPLLQEVKSVRAANLLWATDAFGHVLASTDAYPPLGQSQAAHPLILRALTGKTSLGFDWFTDSWWMVLSLPVTASSGNSAIGTVNLALLIGEAYVTRLAELVGADIGFIWQSHYLWSSNWPAATRAIVISQAQQPSAGIPLTARLWPSGTYCWMARPLTVGIYPELSRPIALLGARINETVIHQTARGIEQIAAATMLLGAVLLLASIRRLTRPLAALVADVRQVGEGKLEHRARVQGAKEVAGLAEAFNHMLNSVQQSREELVKATRFTENAIRRMMNSVIVTDADGNIRTVNPATLELLGFAQEELMGRHLVALFPDANSPFTSERWKHFIHEGIIRNLETYCRSKYNLKIPVLLSGVVLRDEQGQIEGVVCVAQDITERKRLDQMKDEFIRMASHELRSPLTSIRESVALIMDGTLGPVSDEQKEFLRVAYQETRRLERLSTTLVDLSVLESGGLVLKPQQVMLEEAVNKAWKSVAQAAGSRQFTQDLKNCPSVYADSTRVVQILEHLLSNAVQFTPEDGRIAVTAAKAGSLVAVSVIDNGVGIAPEISRTLFQKFVQPGRADEERPGVGLGLVLCKKLVELHGGTVDLSSEPGKGSTFTVTLPIENG